MYKKEPKGWLKHCDFLLLDMICLQLAFVLSYLCRQRIGNPYESVLYRNMAVFVEFADVFVIFFFETLKNVLKRGYYREFATTLKHVVCVELLAVLYLFSMQEGQEYSRAVLFLMGLFYLVLTYTVRVLWKKLLAKRMKKGGDRALLIVTTSDIAAAVIENVRVHNYEMFTIAGLVILGKNMVGAEINGVKVVADEEHAAAYVCREWIDEVFIIPDASYIYPQKLIDQISETGVTVHLNLAKVADTLGKKQMIEKIGSYTVLTTSMNVATMRQLFFKRAMDIAGGLVGCILTGIIFVFIAPVIYISSPGPIFFSQDRIGRNGKKFKIYKFRSMYMDAEARKAELMKENRMGDSKMFKLDFDPRVIGNKILPDGTKKTGIGNFIRVTSLDEFPQFFNVLKGDMSIVGTRPPLPNEWEAYELHHRARLAIKPGITGMWQVSGRSEITDFEEVVKLDTKYINEWSLGLDIKILFKTVMVVLKKEGSM